MKQLFLNESGNLSSKRIMSWTMFLCSIVLGFLGLYIKDINETVFITVFTGFTTSWISLAGITTLDKKYANIAARPMPDQSTKD